MSQAETLLDAAQLALKEGRHDAGRKAAAEAAQLAREQGDGLLHARALALESSHAARMYDHEAAVRCGRQALEALRRSTDRYTEVDVLTTLSFAYKALGMNVDALRSGHEAELGALELHDDRLLAWACLRIAAAHEGLSDYGNARRWYQRSARVGLALEDDRLEFTTLHNFANSITTEADDLRESGRADEALACNEEAATLYERARPIAECLADKGPLTLCLLNSASTLTRLGRYEEAKERLQRAHAVAMREGLHWRVPLVREAELKVLLIQGNHEAYIDGALALMRDHPDIEKVAGDALYAGLYESYKHQGRFEDALRWCEAMIVDERRQMKQRSDAQARLLMEQMATEQARQEAETARQALRSEVDRTAKLEAERNTLAEQAADLARAAYLDALTGLPNRRQIEAQLPALIKMGGACVAIFDVDHFKKVNDTFGHPVGDEVLRQLAGLLTANLRSGDEVARLGGEEFVLQLSHASLEEAVGACQRLREAVQDKDWAALVPGLAVTISVGVAPTQPGDTLATVLSRADAALYRAKQEGRNRVVAGA